MSRWRSVRRGIAGLVGLAAVVGLLLLGSGAASAAPVRGSQTPEVSRSEAIKQLRIVRESIDETLRLIKEGHSEQAFTEAKRGYLSHFEYVEVPLRVVDGELTSDAETKFAEIRGLVTSGAPTSEIRSAIVELRRLIDDAERRLTDTGVGAPAVAAGQSFVIIFREGLEAVLLVSVLLGYLEAAKAGQYRKPILWGMAAALAATVVTFFILRTVLAAIPLGREILEAVTAIVAVVMLFYVSFWLIARLEQKRWMEFLRARVWSAISVGSTTALMLVGFTAVYREGFETALFYQALLSFGPGLGIWVALGFALGVVALGIVAWIIFKLGRRVPVKAFLGTAVVVLMVTSVALLGNAVRSLQEADAVALHRWTDWPQAPIFLAQSLGYWPSRETLSAQLALSIVYLAGALYMFVIRPRRHRGSQPEARRPVVVDQAMASDPIGAS
ncbi:MAG: iron permease [Acidimicrobiales bacterium]|nr:iron permease [Acidimicrobiales bacterium]